jgi:hypothetical protein
MKCEAIRFREKYEECGKYAKFKIMDIACGFEDGEFESFWVCEDCISFFIRRNEDNPHYIIIEERKGDKK